MGAKEMTGTRDTVARDGRGNAEGNPVPPLLDRYRPGVVGRRFDYGVDRIAEGLCIDCDDL